MLWNVWSRGYCRYVPQVYVVPHRIESATVCGPDSFLYDTRNEVAKYQLDIARGTASGSKDVFLHTESYRYVVSAKFVSVSLLNTTSTVGRHLCTFPVNDPLKRCSVEVSQEVL
jgi:hypothetical protein